MGELQITKKKDPNALVNNVILYITLYNIFNKINVEFIWSKQEKSIF